MLRVYIHYDKLEENYMSKETAEELATLLNKPYRDDDDRKRGLVNASATIRNVL